MIVGDSRAMEKLDYEPDFALAENNEVLTSLRPEKEEKDEYFEEKPDVAISLNSFVPSAGGSSTNYLIFFIVMFALH